MQSEAPAFAKQAAVSWQLQVTAPAPAALALTDKLNRPSATPGVPGAAATSAPQNQQRSNYSEKRPGVEYTVGMTTADKASFVASCAVTAPLGKQFKCNTPFALAVCKSQSKAHAELGMTCVAS